MRIEIIIIENRGDQMILRRERQFESRQSAENLLNYIGESLNHAERTLKATEPIERS